MAKKCLTNEEFNEVLELFGKSQFRSGSILYTEQSRTYHYALFIYFPEYGEKVLDTMLEKFGKNIDFETKFVPNEDFTEAQIKDYVSLYKLKGKITKNTPILELKVRGYINDVLPCRA